MVDYKKYVLKIFIYVLGLFISAFGVVMMVKANLGLGSWDSVNYSLSELIGIKLGYASMIINLTLLLFIIIYRKNAKYLISAFPIFIMGSFINIWEYNILVNLEVTSLIYQMLLTLLGVLIMPFGLAIIILSGFPSMIFDELTFVMMDITKVNNFGIIRIGIELFAVVLASIIGLFVGFKFVNFSFGGVGIGTLIVVFTIGHLINFYNNMFKKLINIKQKATRSE